MIPFSKEHDQWVLREIHNRGIEMTPDELIATRKSGFRKVRSAMKKLGILVSEDDVEFLAMIRKMWEGQHEP